MESYNLKDVISIFKEFGFINFKVYNSNIFKIKVNALDRLNIIVETNQSIIGSNFCNIMNVIDLDNACINLFESPIIFSTRKKFYDYISNFKNVIHNYYLLYKFGNLQLEKNMDIESIFKNYEPVHTDINFTSEAHILNNIKPCDKPALIPNLCNNPEISELELPPSVLQKNYNKSTSFQI